MVDFQTQSPQRLKDGYKHTSSRNDLWRMRLKLIQEEYYSIETLKSQSNTMELFCILLHCDFYKQEWSAAPSIFNIKAQGLAHCLYQLKLSLDEVYKVRFHAIQTVSDGRARIKYFYRNIDKSLRCCYKQNNRKQRIYKQHTVDTAVNPMSIDEIPIVILFLCSV